MEAPVVFLVSESRPSPLAPNAKKPTASSRNSRKQSWAKPSCGPYKSATFSAFYRHGAHHFSGPILYPHRPRNQVPRSSHRVSSASSPCPWSQASVPHLGRRSTTFLHVSRLSLSRLAAAVWHTLQSQHPILCITDPRAISYILGAQGAYDKFPKPQGVREWFKRTLGEGILYVEGKEAHERQRRVLAPALSPQSVRHFTSIFYETSSKLVAQWNKLLDNDNMDELEIEVTDWAGRFALETVARAAFSYDFNLLSGEPDPLLEALDGLTNNEHNATSFYMRALFWIFPAILSLGKKGEMVRKTKTELGDLARRMWREAKVANDSHETTLMALMLKADTDSEQRMDEEEVVAQMRTILSAGYETVSATIAWTLYELALNPDIQAKLRAEVTCAPGDPTLDELTSKFPILNAVLLETLRLHPPILENHHQADETISVPLSEPVGTSEHRLVIPKGTILFIPVNVIQSDPDIWGVNADSFRIERWLQPGPKPSLLAFSEGPRSCIGKRFAVAEIKALVLTVIRHFSVSCKHDIEPFQSFVVRPRVKGTPMSSLPLIVKRL